jgi:hypothetical protein
VLVEQDDNIVAKSLRVVHDQPTAPPFTGIDNGSAVQKFL